MTVTTTGVEDAIEASFRKFGVPGAVVGITRNGEHQVRVFGVASLESGLPVVHDTVFRVASITKPFTATLVMALVARGVIDLDRPVHDYLPHVRLSDGSRNWQRAITMRHLLSHTAGLDCELLHNLGRIGNGEAALAKAVDMYGELHQWAAPGTTMSYGNTGYWLAGRVIEVVTRGSFERAMLDYVFRPLGLHRTVFSAEQAIINPVALGHHPVEEHAIEHRLLRTFGYPRARRASGGVISSAEDLLTFADWHLGSTDKGPAIPSTVRDSMRDPIVRLRGSDDESWGIGWDLRSTSDGTRLAGHGGSFGGYQTLLTLVPEHDFAFVVLTNSAHGSKAIREIERTILREELGQTLAERQPVSLNGSDLAAFTGTWAQPLAKFEISAEDGQLNVVAESVDLHGNVEHRSQPIRFDPIGKSDFIVRDGPHIGSRADFVLDPSTGEPRFLRYGLRVAHRA